MDSFQDKASGLAFAYAIALPQSRDKYPLRNKTQVKPVITSKKMLLPMIKFKGFLMAEQWWHTPLITALGRSQVDICEFKDSVVYRVSTRIAAALVQRNPVL